MGSKMIILDDDVPVIRTSELKPDQQDIRAIDHAGNLRKLVGPTNDDKHGTYAWLALEAGAYACLKDAVMPHTSAKGSVKLALEAGWNVFVQLRSPAEQ